MRMIKVWIDEEIYDIIKEAADTKEMSVSEYSRDILSKNSTVELTIDFADIDRYVDEMEQLQRKIDAILPSIFRSGKIYEQEAALIKQTLNKISDKVDDTWRYVTTLRVDLYDSVRKKLYKTVKQNSYSKRHTKETLSRLENKYKEGDSCHGGNED